MKAAALLITMPFAINPWTDRAFSDEGIKVAALLREAVDFSISITEGEPKRAIDHALNRAYDQARVDNWDGEGSARVQPGTYAYATQFSALLPRDATVPEVYVDSDGEIRFEWNLGPRRVFAVSVANDGTLSYARLIGHETLHGSEALRDDLPLAIADSLSRIAAATP